MTELTVTRELDCGITEGFAFDYHNSCLKFLLDECFERSCSVIGVHNVACAVGRRRCC